MIHETDRNNAPLNSSESDDVDVSAVVNGILNSIDGGSRLPAQKRPATEDKSDD